MTRSTDTKHTREGGAEEEGGGTQDGHQTMAWKESVTLCRDLQPHLVGFHINRNENHLNVLRMEVQILL